MASSAHQALGALMALMRAPAPSEPATPSTPATQAYVWQHVQRHVLLLQCFLTQVGGRCSSAPMASAGGRVIHGLRSWLAACECACACVHVCVCVCACVYLVRGVVLSQDTSPGCASFAGGVLSVLCSALSAAGPCLQATHKCEARLAATGVCNGQPLHAKTGVCNGQPHHLCHCMQKLKPVAKVGAEH